MSLSIPANDHGRIYIYDVVGPAPVALVEKDPDALQDVFGVALNPDFVDVVETDNLSGLPLSSYIKQGYEMPEDGMDRDLLDRLKGTVILLMSRAFGGEAVELSPGPSVNYATTVAEPASFTPTEPLRSEGATGTVPPPPTKAPKSDAAMGGRVAMIALIVLFALVGLMLWVAA